MSNTILIRGKVTGNILCKYEAELRERTKPKFGSVRLKIEAIMINNVWHSIDYLLNCEQYKVIVPFLEMGYVVDSENYWLICDLKTENRVELTVDKEAIYLHKTHKSKYIKENNTLLTYLKIIGNKNNISFAQDIGKAPLPINTHIKIINSLEAMNLLLNEPVQTPDMIHLNLNNDLVTATELTELQTV